MTKPNKPKPLHRGERYVQEKKNTPTELANQIGLYISQDMPEQHASFFKDLTYLPLGIMDEEGQPWASVLVTKSENDPSINIRKTAQNQLSVTTMMSPDDPFYRAMSRTQAQDTTQKQLFAGVGVDFTNRRRNKLAGSLQLSQMESSGKLSLVLNSDQHLGNCPKYITVRSLEPQARTPETRLNIPDSFDVPLLEYCKDHISRVSTVFLATKHIKTSQDPNCDQSDMGFNHRGGAPGFVRTYEEAVGKEGKVMTYLILPDFSGNRFYQSLGNIQTDPLVGLVFPDFKTGDMLHVTGVAENLYDEQAQAIMPHVNLITRIQITGAVFIKEALNLRMTSDESYSPYNPPVRYLRHELEYFGKFTVGANEIAPVLARLESVKELTSTVATFTFNLSEAISAPPPGGFAVFDFSKIMDQGYMHMNESRPQDLNDDYMRTWTISTSAEYDAIASQFSELKSIDVTVKLKPNGLISSFLHKQKKLIEKNPNMKLEVPFLGSGGEFSCFKKEFSDEPLRVPQKMLWIAGGVGITPFMAMWDGIREMARTHDAKSSSLVTDIILMFSGRGDDIKLVQHFLNKRETYPDSISLKVVVFQSQGTNNGELDQVIINNRRIDEADLSLIEDISDRELYLCGPEEFMRTLRQWSKNLAVPEPQVHQESFFF